MRRILVVDIETTGEAPPAEVIELGWISLLDGALDDASAGAELFRPNAPIPAQARAVHHITDEMVADRAPFDGQDGVKLLLSSADALAAHNADFERQWISPEITGPASWICTYKCALRIWPDAPAHSNQVLRYWLGVNADPDRAMPPHRALPDAYVTSLLLLEMLKIETVETLIAWSAEPRLMPRVNFGKHRGSDWKETPADYLAWIVDKSDLDADTKWNAQRELDRRRSIDERFVQSRRLL